jgi:ABC-type nitrate/sulfonate/bicarbonate transport system substrate-binding protein
MKPEAMADALMARTIDAVSTWNYPLTRIKRQLGTNATILFDREIYTETYNVAAQQAYVGKNPETVKHFLRAMIKAENFVANNEDEAQSIMSLNTKTDKDLVREVWSAFNYRVVLDQRLLVTLEDESRWAMKNKLTDQTVMPNYSDFIYPDALRAVKPEAVRINR